MELISSRLAVTSREGLQKIIRLYDEKPRQFAKEIIGQTFTDRQKYMEVAQTGDFGMAAEVAEGTPVPTDRFHILNAKQYSPLMRAIAFNVTEQALETDLYGIVKNYASRVGLAMNKTQEQVAANVVNLQTDSGTTGPDGKALAASDHPSEAGSLSNLGSSLALGIPNLETAVQALIKQKGHRGDPMPCMGPFRLYVHPDRAMLAERIVKAHSYPGTNWNDPNPAGAKVSDVHVNPFFTNSYAWALRSISDDEHGIFMLKRIPRRTKMQDEARTISLLYVCYEEYICSFMDWRGYWGTAGTA